MSFDTASADGPTASVEFTIVVNKATAFGVVSIWWRNDGEVDERLMRSAMYIGASVVLDANRAAMVLRREAGS